MRTRLSICAVLAMLGVVASEPANGQQQNQSDFGFVRQRTDKPAEKARKSGSIVINDYDAKKQGGLKGKASGKRVEEGGQSTVTHKLPSGGKAQKKPDSLGRIKTQFPWQRRD